MLHNYETEKITREASDMAEYIELQVFCHVTGFTSYFLGQNNGTTRYNIFWRAGCSRLEYVDICSVY